MRIFRCNFAKFTWEHAPGPLRMVVPSALPLKLICDETLPPLGNFLRTPLHSTTPVRVARHTFCQEVKSNPEKSQILRQGAKKGSTIFSKFISSYKVI